MAEYSDGEAEFWAEGGAGGAGGAGALAGDGGVVAVTCTLGDALLNALLAACSATDILDRRPALLDGAGIV